MVTFSESNAAVFIHLIAGKSKKGNDRKRINRFRRQFHYFPKQSHHPFCWSRVFVEGTRENIRPTVKSRDCNFLPSLGRHSIRKCIWKVGLSRSSPALADDEEGRESRAQIYTNHHRLAIRKFDILSFHSFAFYTIYILLYDEPFCFIEVSGSCIRSHYHKIAQNESKTNKLSQKRN